MNPGKPPAGIASSRAMPESRVKWEKFAKENPYHYILTSLRPSDTDEFWRSGERTFQQEFLPVIERYGVPPRVSLEIGCGIGRLAVPVARRFEQALGADISPSMVERARTFARDNVIENVLYEDITGPSELLEKFCLFEGKCDFVYSLLVFQHISDFSAIEAYLKVVGLLLSNRGIAYLQFDTRPRILAYRIKTRLPDFLLPVHWRRGIRRLRRTPQEIDKAIRAAGLAVIGELSPGTADHRYLLRRPGEGTGVMA